MIAFCTTVKGRSQHLKLTLPKNLSGNADFADCKFIVLDYSSTDDVSSWVYWGFREEIAKGRIVLYHVPDKERFHVAHAKNMAARLGMREGADILVTLDADNFTGAGFAEFVHEHLTRKGMFLCPDFPRIKSLPHGPGRPGRGYAGRLAIHARDFLLLGGYDETFDTWRGEDIDLIARLQRLEFEMGTIPNRFLDAIPHNSRVRFKEYPEAKRFENQHEWRNIYNRGETVVNEGRFGCGIAYRNFDPRPIELKRLPTRIFGIGMHKTATTSLHDAFKILGFESFHWETNRKAWRIWAEMKAFGKSPFLERYYALCDLPIPMLFRELDKAYPGSKFILTTRTEDNWIKSVEGLFDPKVNPYYDWDRQPYSHRLHRELYGRIDFDRDTMLARYRRHNAEVIEYFKGRREDLLVMDLDWGWPKEDGKAHWHALCGFLDKPIPDVDYPHSYAAY